MTYRFSTIKARGALGEPGPVPRDLFTERADAV